MNRLFLPEKREKEKEEGAKALHEFVIRSVCTWEGAVWSCCKKATLTDFLLRKKEMLSGLTEKKYYRDGETPSQNLGKEKI